MTYDSAQDCRDSYTVALSEMARICERGWTCPANGDCASKGKCLARMRCLDDNVTLGRDCSFSGGHCTSVYCLWSCSRIQKPEHISAPVARFMEKLNGAYQDD